MRLPISVLIVALLAMGPGSSPVWIGDPAEAPAACAAHRPAPAALDQLQFVPNLGQWSKRYSSTMAADEVRYAMLGETTAWLCDDGFTVRLERWTEDQALGAGTATSHRRCSGGVVRTRFVGAATTAFEVGEPFSTRHNFFVGDRASWRSDVPSYGSVTMRSVLPGIDVQFRSLSAGAFEYDLLLAPGADLDGFVARCEGVDRLRIDGEGRLIATVPTPEGEQELVQHAPIAWQCAVDGRRSLPIAFRLLGPTSYGFVAGDLDPALSTVVDPGVVWGTFLGGGATERINAMQWQPGAGVWVAGWTGSTDFPTTVGAFATQGAADGFVARLSDNGQSLLFATYLGGSGGEEVRALALGPGLTPTAVGFTDSADFPTTPSPLQANYLGGSVFLEVGDAFVVRLDAAGSSLMSATYLGGVYDDVAEAVAVDAQGNAIVAGWTSSADFPTSPGSYQPNFNSLPAATTEGFVCGVAANGQTLQFGTFIGGTLAEQLVSIARDPQSGALIAAGWSNSADYPTTPNVLRPTSGGGIDAVITRFNANATSATFSTYLGGLSEDVALAVRLAGDGSIWLGGFTDSVNFPATANAPQTSVAGANDGFVTRISGNGQTILFSTLLGGPQPDRVRDLDLAVPGILVVGEAGNGFPVTLDAVQPTFAGGIFDGFVTFLSNGGATISWSSYLGGSQQEALGRAVFDDSGLAVVAGWTFSSQFPINPPGLQSQLVGTQDGVVLQLDMLTDLGEGLLVAPAGAPTVEVVVDGEVELLRFGLDNVTYRTLAVDSVRLFVTGVGAGPSRVTNLRVVQLAMNGNQTLVGGPAQPIPGGEITVMLDDVTLPGRTTTQFAVLADVTSDPSGRSVEVAAAIIGTDAWQVRALGAGAGPTVRLLGNGRAEGPVFVLGSLPGDCDDTGLLTVVDVRLLVTDIGTADPAVDVDGDGVLTPADALATKQAVLGRSTVFSAPTQVLRGDWLTFTCLLPTITTVEASLGGRSLVLGRAMPRQLTMRVGADHPVGVQELVVTVAGRTLFLGLVEVL